MATAPKIVSGSTETGATAWQQYPYNTVFVVVDTSAAGFTTTPLYITSLAGDHYHWETTGATSIYEATPKSFKVYVRWPDNPLPLTPEKANEYNWHINWLAVAP